MKEKKAIGIVGLGPVGCILAAHLVANGENVVVEDILSELLHQVKKSGLHISGIKQIETKIGKTAGSMAELARFEPEIVFIATKASALRHVLPEIRQIYSPEMKIVGFQNGLDNERLIAESLGVDTAYRVIINYAGNTKSAGHVNMNWFQPPNYVGAFKEGRYVVDETTRKIAEVLTASGLETRETGELRGHEWKKTILNSALCSICAVTGQTMKEAMESDYTSRLASKLLEEGLEVAKRDGYDFGEEALAEFAAYLSRGGAHKPSMLIDVENERQTEVDFMSGAIARYGRKHGVPTPVNNTFTSLLKTIESRYMKSRHVA